MDKPVGSPFGQIANNSGLIRPITDKRQREPETGVSDGFEEVEHDFPLGAFRLGKQDYLFRIPPFGS